MGQAFTCVAGQKAKTTVGLHSRLLIAFGVVLDFLHRLGGQGNAFFGPVLGALGFSGRGLMNSGVDVGFQTLTHLRGAYLGVSDFLQVDAA